jgi:chromosome segregation ATPase
MPAYDDIDAEIVRRITDAADELYAEGGSNAAPSVDAVRRRARANMNHASLVMRDWRQRLKAQPGAAADAMPEAMRHLGSQLTQAVWREANRIATGHLTNAKAAWEAERTELAELGRQLSTAFDVQSAELEQAKCTIGQLQADLAAQATIAETLEQRAAEAEAAKVGRENVMRHAQEEINELRSLLRASQVSQERMSLQLQQYLAAQAEAAERNLMEQRRLYEQIDQLRKESEELRAQLGRKPTGPARVTATGRKKPQGRDSTMRAKPANPEGE